MKSFTQTRGLPAHNSPNLIFRKERTELTIHKSRIVAELAEKKEILFSQEEDIFFLSHIKLTV